MARKSYFPYGGVASPGKYMCVDCFYVHTNKSGLPLPECPKYTPREHLKKMWRILWFQMDQTTPGGVLENSVESEPEPPKREGADGESGSNKGIAFAMGLAATKERKWR